MHQHNATIICIEWGVYRPIPYTKKPLLPHRAAFARICDAHDVLCFLVNTVWFGFWQRLSNVLCALRVHICLGVTSRVFLHTLNSTDGTGPQQVMWFDWECVSDTQNMEKLKFRKKTCILHLKCYVPWLPQMTSLSHPPTFFFLHPMCSRNVRNRRVALVLPVQCVSVCPSVSGTLKLRSCCSVM